MCEWRTIKGFKNYMISDDGRVFSYYKNRILKPEITHDGYLRVLLCEERVKIHKRIHRLVAETFIPNPDNLPQVNHIDEDKNNNRVENLEWCTNLYNQNYGTRNERVAAKNSIPIAAYNKNGELVAEYASLGEAAEDVGGSRTAINNCLKGRSKTSAGYVWKYI